MVWNLWLRLSWKDSAPRIKDTGSFRNEDYYFKEGITYSALGGGLF
jgi:hypothetical protein